MKLNKIVDPNTESMIDEYLSLCGDTMASLNEASSLFKTRPGSEALFDHLRYGTHPKIDSKVRSVYDNFIDSVFNQWSLAFDEANDLSNNSIAEDGLDPAIEKSLTKIHAESFSLSNYGRRVIWERLKNKCEKSGPKFKVWVDMLDFCLKVENGDLDTISYLKSKIAYLKSLPLPKINDDPQDFELGVVGMALFATQGGRDISMPAISFSRIDYYVNAGLDSQARRLEEFYKRPGCFDFGLLWKSSGFARVEVGHKLAAAFSLTDIPDSVESPWDYWSLVVPPDMFPIKVVIDDSDIEPFETNIRRVWCRGSDPIMIVVPVPQTKDSPAGIVATDFNGMNYDKEAKQIVTNLTRSLCLAVTNKNSDRKGVWGKNSASKGSKFRPKIDPQNFGERYVIGRPVTIDLREDLRKIIRGERSGKTMKYSFLVRGHWRNQCYGPGRQQHRRQWIEPFWKGAMHDQMLLKSYDVKKDE